MTLPLRRWRLAGWTRRNPQLALGLAFAGLILLIFGLSRIGRAALAPAAVASYIGAAYWFTSSTSFANPAVTVGRAFTDTFAGIAPASVAPFIAAQMLGAALGLGIVTTVYGTHPVPTLHEAAVPPAQPELASS